jgi:hypothetical protein
MCVPCRSPSCPEGADWSKPVTEGIAAFSLSSCQRAEGTGSYEAGLGPDRDCWKKARAGG